MELATLSEHSLGCSVVFLHVQLAVSGWMSWVHPSESTQYAHLAVTSLYLLVSLIYTNVWYAREWHHKMMCLVLFIEGIAICKELLMVSNVLCQLLIFWMKYTHPSKSNEIYALFFGLYGTFMSFSMWALSPRYEDPLALKVLVVGCAYMLFIHHLKVFRDQGSKKLKCLGVVAAMVSFVGGHFDWWLGVGIFIGISTFCYYGIVTKTHRIVRSAFSSLESQGDNDT